MFIIVIVALKHMRAEYTAYMLSMHISFRVDPPPDPESPHTDRDTDTDTGTGTGTDTHIDIGSSAATSCGSGSGSDPAADRDSEVMSRSLNGAGLMVCPRVGSGHAALKEHTCRSLECV